MAVSRIAVVVLVAAIAVHTVQGVIHTPGDGSMFRAIQKLGKTEHLEGETPFEWFPRAAMEAAKELGAPYKKLGEWQCPTWDPNSYCTEAPDLYWRWMPRPIGSLGVPPNTSALTWASPCFAVNTATMNTDILGIHRITVQSSQPTFTTAECIDHYMFATTEFFTSHEVKAQTGDNSVTFDAHILPMTRDDTKEWFKLQGVRIFRYLDGANDTHDELLATLNLFFPSDVIGPHVPDQKTILKFINDYAGIQYPWREDGILDLDEDLVKDGTTLGVFRADGLATIQIWATGAHTNHIAVAIRINGTLHVVESTDKTSYWPNPNIQQTVWAEWFKLAYRANYSVVLLPLKDNYQSMFDTNKEAVLDFINGSLGHPYGYHNYLFGFFDLPDGNLPFPASWQLFEILLSIFDLVDPKTGTKMWGEAFSQRIYGFSTTNTTVALSNAAWTEKGWNFGEMWAIPEQDSWVYSNGPSRVCDVYACTMYKVAGFFGAINETIQCTEFQNSDHYQLNFFNMTAQRPAICQQTDPNLPYCQMTGEVSLTLNKPSTTEPYPNMDQKCPSVPQQYLRPSNC